MASRLYEILRKDVFSDIETGPQWSAGERASLDEIYKCPSARVPRCPVSSCVADACLRKGLPGGCSTGVVAKVTGLIPLHCLLLYISHTYCVAGSLDCNWPGRGFLCKFHVKFHVIQRGFSNMVSHWVAAVLPANQMPDLEIFVN